MFFDFTSILKFKFLFSNILDFKISRNKESFAKRFFKFTVLRLTRKYEEKGENFKLP